MDTETELMRARENQIYPKQYKQVLDKWSLLPYDQNGLESLLNNLIRKEKHRSDLSAPKKLTFPYQLK